MIRRNALPAPQPKGEGAGSAPTERLGIDLQRVRESAQRWSERGAKPTEQQVRILRKALPLSR